MAVNERVLIALGAEQRLKELRAEVAALEAFLAGGTRPANGTPKPLHWTQRPENKARVQRLMRKAQRARKR